MVVRWRQLGRIKRSALLLGVVTSALGCGKGNHHPAQAAAGGTSMAPADANGAAGGAGGSEPSTQGRSGSGSAGTGAASEGGAPTSLPRPAWEPPFELGSPGWRDSSEPYCQEHGAGQLGVWADEHAVVALVSTTCNPLANQGPCGYEGLSLQRNAGAGWQTVYDLGPGAEQDRQLRLTGLPGGPTILVGYLDGEAGVFFMEENGPELRLPLEGNDAGRDMFVVERELAYVLDGDRVVEYANGAFAELARLPSLGAALWADHQRVVVVGSDQTIFVKRSQEAEFVALEGVPAGNYRSVWGFGEHDIWAGGAAGHVAHFDGERWEMVQPLQPTGNPGVAHLWGSAEGELFFATGSSFGRIEGGDAEPLLPSPGVDLQASGINVTDIWGVSGSELFVAIEDVTFRDFECGSSFIVWYDGTTFHAF